MKRSYLKILLVFLVAGLCSLALLAIAASVFLSSPQMTRSALDRLQPTMEDLGVSWKAHHLEIIPVNGLRASQLKLILKSPLPVQGHLFIDKLDISYNLNKLWQRMLIFENFLLSGVSGKLQLLSSDDVTSKKEQDQDTSFNLSQLWTSFPLHVEIKNFLVKNTDIDFSYSSPSQDISAQIRLERLFSQWMMDRKQISFVWEIDQQADLSLKSQSQSSKSDSMILSTGLALKSAGKVVAEAFDDEWKMHSDVKDLTILLEGLSFKSLQDKLDTHFSIQNLSFKYGIEVTRPKSPFFKFHENDEHSNIIEHFLPMEIGSKGKLSALKTKITLQEKLLEPKYKSLTKLINDRLDFEFALKTELQNLSPKSIVLNSFFLQNTLKTLALFKDGGENSSEAKASNKSPVLSIKGAEFIVASQAKASSARKPQGGVLHLASDVRVSDVRVKQDKPLYIKSFNQKGELNVDLSSGRAHVHGDAQLANKDVLSFKVEMSDMQSNAKASFAMDTSLSALDKVLNLGIFSGLSMPPIDLFIDQKAEFSNKKPIWLVSNFGELGDNVQHRGEVKLIPVDHVAKTSIQYDQADIKIQSSLKEREINTKLDLTVKNLFFPLLEKKIDIHQILTLDTSLQNLFEINLNSHLIADSVDMEFDLVTLNRDKEFRIQSTLDAGVSRKIQELLSSTKILSRIGDIKLSSSMVARLIHGARSIDDLAIESILSSPISIEGIHDFSILHREKNSLLAKDLLFRTRRPISISTNLDLNAEKAKFSSVIKVPDLEVPGLIALEDLKVHSRGNLASWVDQRGLKVGLDLNLKTVDIKLPQQEFKNLKSYLVPMDISSNLTSQDLKRFDLDKFSVSIGKKLLNSNTIARFNVDDGKGSLSSQLDVHLPGAINELLDARGQMSLKTQVAMEGAKNFSITMRPQFDNLYLRYADFQLNQLSGSLSIDESLLLRNGEFSFLSLVDYNPFNRVDYNYVEPVISDKPSVFIKKVHFDGKSIGPIQMRPEIRQNLLLMNAFKASLFGGSVVGNVFVDLNPKQPMAGFLGRFTRINPNILAYGSSQMSQEAKFLSGRSATAFDIKKRLINGRVDITSIGRDQLLAVLDALDPKREDAQINAARKALYVAYPSQVTVEMAEGSMDLAIQLSGALSQLVEVRSLPLTPLLQSYLGDLLIELEARVAD